jgi:hypothetical protein
MAIDINEDPQQVCFRWFSHRNRGLVNSSPRPDQFYLLWVR